MASQRLGWLAAVGLLVLATAEIAQATNLDPFVFEEEFFKKKIAEQLPQIAVKLKPNTVGLLLADFEETQPTKVKVKCLNTTAPAPLNWKMWCPGKDASVSQWQDKGGAVHRKIVLRPIANMTAKQAIWFATPAFPKTMEMGGKTWSKHKLWHPIDHKGTGFRLGLGTGPQEPFVLQTLINETYRDIPPKGKAPRTYLTDAWFSLDNIAGNIPKNRYVVKLKVINMEVFTLLVEYKDSSEGLIISVEIVVGLVLKGYDPVNPQDGNPLPVARTANRLLVEPILAPYKESGDFTAALDAVTRHVVEEFGNLQFFVPIAWEKERKRLAAGGQVEFPLGQY